MTRLARRSAYMLWSDANAQIAAGNQPMIVICRIRQIIPENIFPCNNNESQGKKNAIR